MLIDLYLLLFFKIFYCHSITGVCLFSPSLHPTPAKSTSLHSAPLTPSGNPPTIVHTHGSCTYVLWLLHFLCCTLHPHPYSVTTYLYFLIPLPPHPFPHTTLPSGNHQNALHIHDSVSVLVCLVCFLDSIVDRYVFVATLLFKVLIFLFFLIKSL